MVENGYTQCFDDHFAWSEHRDRPGVCAGNHSVGSKTSSDRILIGLSLDTLKEARWQRDRDCFKARCKELGADVLVNAANSDDSQQARDMQSLIAAGCRVIVIAAHDGVAMSSSAQAAKNAGIR